METKQKSRHVYKDHLDAGLYLSESYDKSHLRTCSQCGDSDDYLGVAETFEQLIELCRWTDDEDGSPSEPDCGYSTNYLREVWASKPR